MKVYRRLVALAVFGYLVCMLGALVVVQLLGDRTELGTLALFSPRHLIVWPWLPLVLLAGTVSWRLAVASVFGALVTLFGVSGFVVPRPAADGASSDDLLRVVVYNTDESQELARRVRADIVAWDADVAALIDCRSGVARALRAVPSYTLVRTPFVCLVTRHEVVSHEPMPPGPIDPDRVSGAGRAGRVHRFTLSVRGRPVTLYVLHLETPRDALWAARNFDLSLLMQNAEFRSIDSRVASRWVDRSAPGLLVMGDFNLTVESAIYRRDWGDLRNAFQQAGAGFGHTMFAGRHRVRIDHVLGGGDLVPVSTRVLRGYPSEHQPVVAEFRWRE